MNSYTEVLAEQLSRMSPGEIGDVLRGASDLVGSRTDLVYEDKWWTQVMAQGRKRTIFRCKWCGFAADSELESPCPKGPTTMSKCETQ